MYYLTADFVTLRIANVFEFLYVNRIQILENIFLSSPKNILVHN